MNPFPPSSDLPQGTSPLPGSPFSPPEPESVSPRRRWLRRLGLLFLLVLAGAGGWLVYHRQQVNNRLQQALEELDRTDPGWRLEDIEAARAFVPDEKNSALVVLAVARLLPRSWPTQAFSDALPRLDPEFQLTPEQFDFLGRELDAIGGAVEKARKLADLPKGRYPIQYPRNPMGVLLNDQQEVRRVTSLLRYDALRCAQAQDLKQATLSCQAALNSARSLGDEPLFISMLIRVACVIIACDTVERVLAQGESAASDLERLQHLLEEEDREPILFIATRGERAFVHATFEVLESGEVPLDHLTSPGAKTGSWLETLFGRGRQTNLRSEHPLCLRMMTRRIEESKLPAHEQIRAEHAFDAEVEVLPEKAVATRQLIPAVTKMGGSARRHHASVRCLLVLLAVERYRLEEGRWPRALAELMPKYLSAVPLDPFDGKPLRYKRLGDGIEVYSIGPDEADNGGAIDRENRYRPGTDFGCRLWDVPRRRQPPRATPEQPATNP
jgi:hypothetical protein